MNEFMKASTCPYCGKVNEFASNPHDDGRPSDGDVTMCIGCGHIAIFDEQAPGGCRKTTALEAAQFSADERISRIHLAWKMMDQRRRARGVKL